MSIKMKPGDPASWMLFDGVETTPVVYSPDCYICNDPEFAQMGLPLCRACPVCGGHIAADDSRCDDCGLCDQYFWEIIGEFAGNGAQDNEIAERLLWGYSDEDYNPVLPAGEQMRAAITAVQEQVR